MNRTPTHSGVTGGLYIILVIIRLFAIKMHFNKICLFKRFCWHFRASEREEIVIQAIQLQSFRCCVTTYDLLT